MISPLNFPLVYLGEVGTSRGREGVGRTVREASTHTVSISASGSVCNT